MQCAVTENQNVNKYIKSSYINFYWRIPIGKYGNKI